MVSYSSNNREQLKNAWKSLISGKDIDTSLVRKEIYDSWKRSIDYEIDPYKAKPLLLSQNGIEQLLRANKHLIEIVHPHMQNLYNIVGDSDTYLVLSDERGVVLEILGDEQALERCKEVSNLVVGADRSESYAGTNAIGTALALRIPFQVWDEEHYISLHKTFCCSTAPIQNDNGAIIGSLTLACRSELGHIHTLGMVISAVGGISKELSLLKSADKINEINAQTNSIIESVPHGVIFLNNEFRVLQVNKKALNMLNIDNTTIIGSNISSPIQDGSEVFYSKEFFDNLKNETQNKETNFYINGKEHPPSKFAMTVEFVKVDGNKQIGTLVMLNNLARIKKVVNKFAGFSAKYTFDDIIANCETSSKVIKTAKKASSSNSNVLILGESGTGKELIAQAIHNASSVSSGPFVAINCGALPKGLIESELFGYEKGSFTGANKDGNPGKFELADGGTIFLDEIGDMPLDVQVSLLRVLQTKEVVRIGAKYPKPINVRIIAATNVDLETAIENSTFRTDLYYRLNVFTINVPPLRERAQDILPLVDHFISNYSNDAGRTYVLSDKVVPALLNYKWPGNIRELENVIERALNLAETNVIRTSDLPKQLLAYVPKDQSTNTEEGIGYSSNVFISNPARVEANSSNGNFNLYDKESSGLLSSNDEAPLDEGSSLTNDKLVLSNKKSNLNSRAGSSKIKDAEYNMILEALTETRGNVKLAADILGLSRRTLYRKFEKYGIDSSKYR